MSQEDVEVVRRSFDAFRRGDFEAWFEFASEDLKVYPNPAEPDANERYEGRDGLLEYLAHWYSGWDDYAVEAERFAEAGGWVLLEAREVGTAEQTGMRIEQTYTHAFKVNALKILEWRQFSDKDDALRAVGL